ncbi:3-hydroxybutyryl-CoA dehydrogenase FadB [Cupriavidus sp. TA19]|uniref:3-hydroxyacyl-CoA dehydrogenase family protein n=1 Tax=unclassified Cupriavidus TaxID=2640874 RepID=UPI0027294B43|nr:3-hydroxyacyl-CoA dehydrogenase NAD-binding domain-containing protein [Cupriavidus sp. TA19]GLC97750.1 3-hydroxybutyryl-CoA dehydrogenase FadB [Cupriavidus sp. TA19]
MHKFLNVAIIGAGLMGHGIAQVFASANHSVTLTDTNEDVLHQAPGHIANNLAQMGIKAEPVLNKIRLERQLSVAVATADLVIEAAPERIALKQRLFQEIAAAAPDDAILASNTSVIPITEIGRSLSDAAKARLLGTHWWNPPHLVPLVEVIRTERTADSVFNETFDILRSVGKCPVKVHKDVPGFIGNRLQHALWREAISLVHRGVCDAETIDIVVKQSFGMRLPVLGPIENADLVGLELTRNVHQIIFPDLDSAQEPSPLLDELLEQGNTGMRSGKGLREWTQESADEVRRSLAVHLIAALEG